MFRNKKTIGHFILCILALIMLISPLHSFAATNPLQNCTVGSKQFNIVKDTVTVKKGKSLKLAYTFSGINKKDIVWVSSNSKIVKVNSKTGKIKGKKGGVAVITAMVRGTQLRDTIIVTCNNSYKLRVKTTGYCNCRSCCGKWAGHRTASGTRPKENRTIAVDKRVIKLGSKVKIGNKMYVAEDTGVHGKTIDIYYSSHRRAHNHGVQYKTVIVYY